MAVKVIERRRSLRHSCAGPLPAPLVRSLDASQLACTSVDASYSGLGMLSPVDLTPGEEVCLAFPDQPMLLVVASKVPLPAIQQFRYGLTCVNRDEDVAARFRAADCLLSETAASVARESAAAVLKAVRSADTRATRFSIDWDLVIQAKTFGTKLSYSLRIANISRSGLFVTAFQKDGAPFIVNTLLDLVIDPDTKYIARPVHGFAKVVRCLTEKMPDGIKKVSFGVVISEIFAEDLALWESFMGSLEQDAVLPP